jgi:hypothetical protein
MGSEPPSTVTAKFARVWDLGYRSNASIVIWLRLDVPKHRLRQDACAALYAKPRLVCGAEIKEIDDTLCSVLGQIGQ